MACVTLKRSLELEPLYSPTGNSAKRRRCAPLTPLFARSDHSHSEHQMARKLHQSSSSMMKQVETRRVFGDNGSHSSNSSSSGAFSPLPMPSNDELYDRIKQEYKRLKRRKQLKYGKSLPKQCSSNGSGSSSGSDNDDNNSPASSRMAARAQNQPGQGRNRCDVVRGSESVSGGSGALFTLEQVVTICNKLLVDRDNTVREEYDRALNEKLAEQYDAFVKFTHDQIQSRLSHSASYVS